MQPDNARLSMSVGEAMFSQRSIRRFRSDPIPMDDLHLILEAAVKAPSGGNRQPARFLVLNEPEVIRQFGALYREAWWAKRRDEKRPWTSREQIPPEDKGSTAAARLADEIKDAPCIVLALTSVRGGASSVIPSVQNLMLAARALGIGSVPTTLHPTVLERVYGLLGIPQEMEFHLCVPMGYPRGNFGSTQRKPASEVTFLNRWGASVNEWTSAAAPV
ncbi:MAG: nitroreductase family protein [Chloroflexi bacterium]|nr:nitroreductase family protein [Chloroflexota bacterium]MBV9134798.1 nitroreductase family protein [Chloroflexota bacterium]